MTPDLLARLDEQWRKFDNAPEAEFVKGGVLLKTPGYLAFLEARKLIEEFRHELFDTLKGWRRIETFFDQEAETPVLLWAIRPETGEPAIMLGYWDDDEHSWYRDGQGASEEDPVLEPTLWMPTGDVTALATEYIAIPRLASPLPPPPAKD